MLASHYAEVVERVVRSATPLRDGPGEDREIVGSLSPGERFGVVEDSVGWAWGYGGADRRVGYVRSGDLAPKAPS